MNREIQIGNSWHPLVASYGPDVRGSVLHIYTEAGCYRFAYDYNPECTSYSIRPAAEAGDGWKIVPSGLWFVVQRGSEYLNRHGEVVNFPWRFMDADEAVAAIALWRMKQPHAAPAPHPFTSEELAAIDERIEKKLMERISYDCGVKP